jgi:2-methylfumaryl-CoA isomerase
VMIVALTERHWHKLIEVTGIGGAIAALETSLKVDLNIEEDRYRYREILEALIRPWFEDRTLDEVSRALNDANILWGPYRSLEGFVNDPTSLLHLTSLMSDVDQPGIGTYPVPGPVLDFSGWHSDSPSPAPRLGQDTDGVLASLLGLQERELAGLRARLVIGSVSA